MKITDTYGPKAPVGAGGDASGPERGEAFRAVFEQALRSAPGADGLRPNPEIIAPESGVAFTRPPRAAELGSGAAIQSEVILELEGALDTVAFYAERLAQPAIPAQDLAPILDHLDQRMTALNRWASQSAVPERLREILADVTLTVGAEIARFRRGDYGVGAVDGGPAGVTQRRE